MKLRYDGKPSPFIIACYGSFIDNETYNIILEYADRGTLEDFLKSAPAPPSSQEMIEYWDRFSSVTHGLATIHGTEASTETNIPVLLGYAFDSLPHVLELDSRSYRWHQDIKPANILVFSGVEHRCMMFILRLRI